MAKLEDSSSQIFDPREYLDHFFYLNKKPGEEPELLEFILRLIKLHEYMKEGNINIGDSLLLILCMPNRGAHVSAAGGGTLVNFGCGPTVHCNISASAVFKDIICAEYTEANRKELNKWLSNDDDKFDWSVFFKYVAVLEGKR